MSEQATAAPAAAPAPQPPAPPAAAPPPGPAPASFPAHNPAGEPAKTAPRIMHHLLPLGSRPNVWKWKAKDKDGNPVQFAPGMTTHVFRGPTNPKDAKASAELYLANARNEAMRNGYDDPGYTLDESSLEPVGTADPLTPDNVGTWKPPGTAPLTLGVGKLEPRDGEAAAAQYVRPPASMTPAAAGRGVS